VVDGAVVPRSSREWAASVSRGRLVQGGVMRAVVRDRYGTADVLRVESLPDPEPGAGEVVVAVHAASINQWDDHLLTGASWVDRMGASTPKHRVLGSDVAGEVVAVGPDVDGLRIGDAVVGELSSYGFGGFAELVRAPESAFVLRPPGVSAVDGAALPQAGSIARQALVQAGMRTGARVLVNGAGGGAGSYAVQLARASGASHTAAVDSAAKLPAVTELGADRVLDFRADDWTRLDGTYDVVVDFEGWLPLHRVRRRLDRTGHYVITGGSLGVLARAAAATPWTAVTPGGRLSVLLWKPHRRSDLEALLADVATGRIRAVVDSTYPLERTADAFARFAGGEFVGKVVVTV
jgi:NADPH:quinone reductase-like Zn-dependent oxidoreductase